MSVFTIDHINTVWRLLVPPDKRLPKWLAWGASVMAGKQWKQDAFFTGYMTGAANLTIGDVILPQPSTYMTTVAYAVGQTVIYAIQYEGSYYGDNAVYQALQAVPIGGANPPTIVYTAPNSAPALANSNLTEASSYMATGNFYWVKVQDNFIGANERVMYTPTRLIFEYALNRWFHTTFRNPGGEASDIYLQLNQLDSDMLYMGPAGNGYNFIPAGYGEAMPYVNITSAPPSTYGFTIYFPVAIYNYLVSPSREAVVTAGHNSTLRDTVVRAFADQYNAAGMTYNIITY